MRNVSNKVAEKIAKYILCLTTGDTS